MNYHYTADGALLSPVMKLAGLWRMTDDGPAFVYGVQKGALLVDSRTGAQHRIDECYMHADSVCSAADDQAALMEAARTPEARQVGGLMSRLRCMFERGDGYGTDDMGTWLLALFAVGCVLGLALAETGWIA